MIYKLNYKYYKRKLRIPLKTYFQEIHEREGFIIQLEDSDGRRGYGDVAPFEYFGTETLDQIRPILDELKNNFSSKINLKKFPCLQFGLNSAEWMLEDHLNGLTSIKLPMVALLSSGKKAIEDIKIYLNQGYKFFKWKICTENNEIDTFKELIKLAPDAQFRLDANGGLNANNISKWLEFKELEYLEQPLAPDQEVIMKSFGNKIALDESALNLEDIKKLEAMQWPGYVVIKPSLIGNLNDFSESRHKSEMKYTYSTALESTIGMIAGITLAAKDPTSYALGYGVDQFFEPDIFSALPIKNGEIHLQELKEINCEEIWSQI